MGTHGFIKELNERVLMGKRKEHKENRYVLIGSNPYACLGVTGICELGPQAERVN